MKKLFIHFPLAVFAFCALGTATVAAQGWRVGVTAGADYNVRLMDMQYMSDFRTEGRWGATLGVSGQYNFTDWLGVRADLNWTQKNYRQYRTVLNVVDYRYRNNYLQLPVMASFSFGGKKLRGFANVGIYGGYWMNSSRWGLDYNSFSDRTYDFSEKVDYPYYIQAVKELGNIRYDFSMLDGVKFSESSTQNMGYLASTISKQFETSTLLAKYADQWDGGRLMTDFRQWAVNNCTANMVYVYAENDPWTGGAIDTPNLANVKRFILRNTVHNDFILNENFYTADDAATVKNAINAFLK